LISIFNYHNAYYNFHYKPKNKDKLPYYNTDFKEQYKSNIGLILSLFSEAASEKEIITKYPHLLEQIEINPPQVNFKDLEEYINFMYDLFCKFSGDPSLNPVFLNSPVLKFEIITLNNLHKRFNNKIITIVKVLRVIYYIYFIFFFKFKGFILNNVTSLKSKILKVKEALFT